MLISKQNTENANNKSVLVFVRVIEHPCVAVYGTAAQYCRTAEESTRDFFPVRDLSHTAEINVLLNSQYAGTL